MDNYSSLIDLIIQDELDGNPSHERTIILGRTPTYLIDHAGFPELELAISAKVVAKAAFDHGIRKSFLKRLPGILEDPKTIFRSANPQLTDSVVVVTLEVKNNAPIIVPIRQNQMVGRSSTFNLVTSIYAKEGPDPEIKWQKSGLLIHKF